MMRGTPEGNKIIIQATNYKTKSDSKRGKSMASISKFLERKELDKAESEMREVLSDVDQFILWLAPRDSQSLMQSIAPISNSVTSRDERREI